MIGLCPQSVVKDQLATVPARHPRHCCGQDRRQKAPRQHSTDVIADPQAPIGAKNGQKHDGKNEMCPTRGANANSRHQQELGGSGKPGQDPHHETDTSRPKRRARPKWITCPPVKRIRTKRADAKCDGKRDQHGVDGMTGNGDLRFLAVKTAMFVDRVARRTAGAAGFGHSRNSSSVSLCKPAAALMVPALAGCGGPLSTLSPHGPAAADIALLWWSMLAAAALITVMVLVLVWRGFVRETGKMLGEAFWIKWMGLYFSLTVLAAVVAAGIWIGERIQARPGADVVRVEAVARQWDWRFHQPGADGTIIATNGRLHIPARTPIDVVIRSEDVIHSFWVPQLAGKMDALPGRNNVLRIEASSPGIYQGTSAEFSGLGYAGMRFEVVAFDPADPPAFTDTDKGTDQ